MFYIGSKSNHTPTLWLYGDSFTEGEGTAMLYKGYEEYHRAYNRYFWGHYYASKWLPGYLVVNRGVSGASTQHILNSILRDIHLWRKEDMVVFGISTPVRISLVCDEVDGPGVRHGYVHLNGIWNGNYTGWNTLARNNLGDRMDPDYKAFSDKILLNNTYALERENLKFRDLARNISMVAKMRGVTCAMFDFTLWTYFEDLETWSSGVIPDCHWSPNGNAHFAHFLKDCLERGVNDLTSEYTSDRDDRPDFDPQDNWKKNGMYEYIVHDGLSKFSSPSYKALLEELGRDCLVEYDPKIKSVRGNN